MRQFLVNMRQFLVKMRQFFNRYAAFLVIVGNVFNQVRRTVHDLYLQQSWTVYQSWTVWQVSQSVKFATRLQSWKMNFVFPFQFPSIFNQVRRTVHDLYLP